jgi:hypothetical protein
MMDRDDRKFFVNLVYWALSLIIVSIGETTAYAGLYSPTISQRLKSEREQLIANGEITK